MTTAEARTTPALTTVPGLARGGYGAVLLIRSDSVGDRLPDRGFTPAGPGRAGTLRPAPNPGHRLRYPVSGPTMHYWPCAKRSILPTPPVLGSVRFAAGPRDTRAPHARTRARTRARAL